MQLWYQDWLIEYLYFFVNTYIVYIDNTRAPKQIFCRYKYFFRLGNQIRSPPDQRGSQYTLENKLLPLHISSSQGLFSGMSNTRRRRSAVARRPRPHQCSHQRSSDAPNYTGQLTTEALRTRRNTLSSPYIAQKVIFRKERVSSYELSDENKWVYKNIYCFYFTDLVRTPIVE